MMQLKADVQCVDDHQKRKSRAGIQMSDTSQGGGWWIASDGKWYPPEVHPYYQVPALPQAVPAFPAFQNPTYSVGTPSPQELGKRASGRLITSIAVGIVAVALVIGAVVAFGSSSKNIPAAASSSTSPQPSSATTDPIPAIASQWTGYTRTFISAAQQENTTFLAAAGDITKQSQRISTDATTASSNLTGSNCTSLITSSDFSAYSSCLSQDRQATTQAENDETAANGEIQRDFTTIDTQVSNLNGYVHTYVSQMGTIGWTPTLLSMAVALGTGVSKWGNDWQQIGAITQANANEIGPLINSTLAQDKSSWEDSMILLAGSLGITDPTITGIH
jgi:hypothetical protein